MIKKFIVMLLMFSMIIQFPIYSSASTFSVERYKTIINIIPTFSISSSGLAGCTISATCDPDYSIGITARLVRELSNGGQLVASWTSPIKVLSAMASGTYQLNTTGYWYHMEGTINTYREGYIYETEEYCSVGKYY